MHQGIWSPIFSDSDINSQQVHYLIISVDCQIKPTIFSKMRKFFYFTAKYILENVSQIVHCNQGFITKFNWIVYSENFRMRNAHSSGGGTYLLHISILPPTLQILLLAILVRSHPMLAILVESHPNVVILVKSHLFLALSFNYTQVLRYQFNYT